MLSCFSPNGSMKKPLDPLVQKIRRKIFENDLRAALRMLHTLTLAFAVAFSFDRAAKESSTKTATTYPHITFDGPTVSSIVRSRWVLLHRLSRAGLHGEHYREKVDGRDVPLDQHAPSDCYYHGECQRRGSSGLCVVFALQGRCARLHRHGRRPRPRSRPRRRTSVLRCCWRRGWQCSPHRVNMLPRRQALDSRRTDARAIGRRLQSSIAWSSSPSTTRRTPESEVPPAPRRTARIVNHCNADFARDFVQQRPVEALLEDDRDRPHGPNDAHPGPLAGHRDHAAGRLRRRRGGGQRPSQQVPRVARRSRPVRVDPPTTPRTSSPVGIFRARLGTRDRAMCTFRVWRNRAGFSASRAESDRGHPHPRAGPQSGSSHDGTDDGNAASQGDMQAIVSIAAEPTSWSDCSIGYINAFLAESGGRGRPACLVNVPSQKYGDPDCGDGFIEAPEECDCGPEGCSTGALADPCCDGSTCRLRSGMARSSRQDCSSTCAPPASPCRPADGACDVERCDGSARLAPPTSTTSPAGRTAAGGGGLCCAGTAGADATCRSMAQDTNGSPTYAQYCRDPLFVLNAVVGAADAAQTDPQGVRVGQDPREARVLAGRAQWRRVHGVPGGGGQRRAPWRRGRRAVQKAQRGQVGQCKNMVCVPSVELAGTLCGNGVLEAGEHDCGGRDCGSGGGALLTDPCCDGAGCRLWAGAQCSGTQACCTAQSPSGRGGGVSRRRLDLGDPNAASPGRGCRRHVVGRGHGARSTARRVRAGTAIA